MPGVESLLAQELLALDAQNVKDARGGVSFHGPLEVGFRAVLWSRIASRILFPFCSGPCQDAEEVFQLAKSVSWHEHMDPESSFAVEVHGSSGVLRDTRIVALKVKDALVDGVRAHFGSRGDVEKSDPDLRIHVAIKGKLVTISLDLGGGPLHERGYRKLQLDAPIKENLAAAILARLGATEDREMPFVDPMCGSGTFLIELAWMRMNRAPGLDRENRTPRHWLIAIEEVWTDMITEARSKIRPLTAAISGYDADARAVQATKVNLKAAGVEGPITVEKRAIGDWCQHQLGPGGLMASNAPYGVRLSDEVTLIGLFQQLGAWLRRQGNGWRVGILTADAELGRLMGLRAQRVTSLYNGPIACKLLDFKIDESTIFARDGALLPTQSGFPLILSEQQEMLANRLKKNLAQRKKDLGKDVLGYRIYDADMPEYNAAMDRYGDYLVVAEYAAPATVDPEKAARRWRDILLVAPEVIGVERKKVSTKVRQRQSGSRQYEREEQARGAIEISEGGLRFEVNLWDYLDTGLFLDHRLVRSLIKELANGKRFLNLFAYTGSATVYAAKGGADTTTTVDISRTYLDWAQRNMALNGFVGAPHRFVCADVLEWLKRSVQSFDLIFLDPPTFSNSKRMWETFDVQRDHVGLLAAVIKLLAPGGTLIFSTNRRKFRLDHERVVELGVVVEDITEATMPPDFSKRPPIHQCWKLEHVR